MSFIDSKLPRQLNTMDLERWLDPNWEVSKYCNTSITWEELDEDLDWVFSIENKKEAFWEKYKDTNVIKVNNPDWTMREVSIPTVVNWWMWTNVSSASMVEAMNNLWFWWHLSSIWLWFYYFQDNFEWFFDKKTTEKEQKSIVQKEFDKLFKEELWLSDELIEKHFFICPELWEEINEKNWKPHKNAWFNWQAWRQRIVRMMDLISTYRTVKKLKDNWNNVWLNAMYKTSSYIAMLKLSVLAWVDYVTTAAWSPSIKNPETWKAYNICPKTFLKDFFEDVKWMWVKMPAFWLLVATSDARIIRDEDYNYDYYVFEEWEKAWWHVLRFWDKYKHLERFKKAFEEKWIPLPPFYAAWWINSWSEIKSALDAWFSWVQIWTSLAVSQEAVDGKWEEFKKRLIWWNHLWPESEIDTRAYEMIEKEKKKFEKLIRVYNRNILKHLVKTQWIDYNEESPEIKRLRDFVYRVVYSDFFWEKIEEINDEEKKLLEQIRFFIESYYDWEDEEIYAVLREYWNALKFLKNFEKFKEENEWKLPTHIVFNSTVWFTWRSRIVKWIRNVIARSRKTSIKAMRWCIWCLTDCILMNRWWEIKADRWSPFCIYDWLDQTEDRENIAFSSPSTVPYDEIRPLRDIMTFFLWKYVTR